MYEVGFAHTGFTRSLSVFSDTAVVKLRCPCHHVTATAAAAANYFTRMEQHMDIGRFLVSGGIKNKREWLLSNLTSEYVLRPPALVQGTDSRGVYWLFLLFDQCGIEQNVLSLRSLDLVCVLTE